MPSSFSLFDDALAALYSGDAARLRRLIGEEPLLVHLRADAVPPLGYFSGATLLHHVAGNPGWRDRSAFGEGTVAAAAALLDGGANPDETTLGPPASTTMRLVLTSPQASDANLSAALIDVLRAHGASLDLLAPGLLDAPLGQRAPRAAEALIARGAPVDLCAAAGLGDLVRVQAAFDGTGRLLERVWRDGRELPAPEAIGLALLFGYVNGQPHVVDALFERDGDWDASGPLDGTALHRAASSGDLTMVQRLVARGADPSNRRNTLAASAFGCALHHRRAETAAWFHAMGLVDLHDAVDQDLVDDVQARLRDDPGGANRRRDHGHIPGGAPLHWAAARNRPLIARLLLAHGADPNLEDGHGRTPLDYAAQQGATGVVAILTRHGGRRSAGG